MARHIATRLWHAIRRIGIDRSANVMLMAGLSLPILIGMAGLAIEGGGWYQTKRSMQNAADAAALAAATNATTSYVAEAKAVTSQYGYTHGSDSVSVAAINTATCPDGATTCYQVTITKGVPLTLSRLVGFEGSGVQNSRQVISLSSAAVAKRITSPREYCILALNTVGTALTSNGAPFADLNGCNVMSDSDATCNGSDLDATYGDAAGTNNGCGDTQNSNVPVLPDPYSAKASNIPTNTCSSYPQADISNNDKTVDNVNGATAISGTYSTTGDWNICGDLVLTGDVTLTGSSVAINIYNGDLLTNGYTIRTASGAAATIVFTGTNSGGYTHRPWTTGAIDIKAPSSGPWSGTALYQDPAITSGVDIDYAGNNPKTPVWDISGLVYMPRANVQFSGVVNKASNGNACFVMVIYNLVINGNGSIFQQTGCATTGLTPPTGMNATRATLVS